MATCGKNHGVSDEGLPRGKAVSDEEGAAIGNRLFQAHTKSWSGNAGEAAKAEDIISKRDVDSATVSERLYSTHTKAQLVTPEMTAAAQDVISRPEVREQELDNIIDRLHTTNTACGGGQVPANKVCNNSVARPPASEGEAKEIFDRLLKTHTKSSQGGQVCRVMEPLKPPGYGLKMYPDVEGIETRFLGHEVPQEKVDEVIGRLRKTQTTASQARIDNPRILLYPERTTLMNNVDRIKAYQDTGAVAKQPVLQRREKWYN